MVFPSTEGMWVTAPDVMRSPEDEDFDIDPEFLPEITVLIRPQNATGNVSSDVVSPSIVLPSSVIPCQNNIQRAHFAKFRNSRLFLPRPDRRPTLAPSTEIIAATLPSLPGT